jgi:hypothetical protein
MIIGIVPSELKNITSSIGLDGNPLKYQYRSLYETFRDGIDYWIEFRIYSLVEKTMIDSFRYNS